MPYRCRDVSASPAKGVESVWAVARKPSGRREIESPWLIQTGCSRSRPANSPSSPVSDTLAGPYSRLAVGSTSPPGERAGEGAFSAVSRYASTSASSGASTRWPALASSPWTVLPRCLVTAPGSDAPGSDAPGSDAPGADAPGADAPGEVAPG